MHQWGAAKDTRERRLWGPALLICRQLPGWAPSFRTKVLPALAKLKLEQGEPRPACPRLQARLLFPAFSAGLKKGSHLPPKPCLIYSLRLPQPQLTLWRSAMTTSADSPFMSGGTDSPQQKSLFLKRCWLSQFSQRALKVHHQRQVCLY